MAARVWKNMDELPSPFEDRLRIEPNEHEVAVERGDWLFYIRVARRGELLIGDGGTGNIFYELILVALKFLFAYPIVWWFDRQPQKVVVIRFDARKTWGFRRPFRGWLSPNDDPAPLVDELLNRIMSGEFDGDS